MYWDIDLISIDESAIGENTQITVSDDKRILSIDNLTFIFTAEAVIGEDGLPGIYENQAWLRTTIIKDNVPVEVESYPSADYYREEGQKSKTIVINGDWMALVSVSISKSKECYSPTNEITITFLVNNPTGQEISGMLLDLSYNEEFEYIQNSAASSISNIGNNPQFDTQGGTAYPGYFFFDRFTLPVGVSTISFNVKAPTNDNLEGEGDDQNRSLDWDGNVLTEPFDPDKQEKIDLIISYDFSTEMEDDCLSTTLNRANGDIVIPYCLSKEYHNKQNVTTSYKID